MTRSEKYFKIQNNFSNANNYLSSATIQRDVAKQLLNEIPNQSFETILELGSGHGTLTFLCQEKLKYHNYIANDLFDAKHINLVGNMLDVEFPKADLIISSSALHWLENDLFKLFEKVKNSLNKNGYFIFSIAIKDNCHEINELVKPLEYFTSEEIKNNLENNFEVLNNFEIIKTKKFASPKELLYEFKETGTKLEKPNYGKIKRFNKDELTYKFAIFVCKGK